MRSNKKKILFIVEGEEAEVSFIGSIGHRLLTLNKAEYEIFPFKTSIYELYDGYMRGEYDYIIDYLVSEKGLNIPDDLTPKESYSAIYLIFDFDFKYHKYTDEIVKDLLAVFDNETENGKLYINYPMFESYFHLENLPDYSYINKTIDTNQCLSKPYKLLVNRVTCIKKSRRIDTRTCYEIIKHNYDKALHICGLNPNSISEVDYNKILEIQIDKKNNEYCIFVLNTLVLFIIDYNPELLKVIKNIV